jgi:hypothetical protein
MCAAPPPRPAPRGAWRRARARLRAGSTRSGGGVGGARWKVV